MTNIPGPILDCLRCFRCHSFLSCGPISVLSNGESLCGRCTVAGSNIFRAVAYEAVAVYFLFPCKYWHRHCAYLLNWNEVIDHEDDCVFKNTFSILCSNPGSLFKPDNKLDLTQVIKVFNVPEPVLKTLTCSVCEYYLSSSPIFTDSKGAGMCHRCFRLREHVPQGFVRHLALEKILQIMIFPCIYRYRGCTHHFRFGLDTTVHEVDCSYGKAQRKIPKTFTDGGKQKGVIETHSGHMFGTITPNSQFFVAHNKIYNNPQYSGAEPLKVIPTEEQGIFFNQLIKHRDNLEKQWRNSKMEQLFPNENDTFAKRYSPNLVTSESFKTDEEHNQEIDRSPSVQQQQFTYDESPGNSSRNSDIQRRSYEADVVDRIPNGKQQPSYRAQSSRSESQNSSRTSSTEQNSSIVDPIQLQPARLTNDPVYSNSFTSFDRFEKGYSQPQRSESLYANQQDVKSYNPEFITEQY